MYPAGPRFFYFIEAFKLDFADFHQLSIAKDTSISIDTFTRDALKKLKNLRKVK